MKLCEGVHCLRIDFYITPQIKRFVFVYILTGTYCYLIDTGVHGSQQIIEVYLKSIGYHLQDIRGVFLTHAHPDHMGSAAAIQKITGCRVYGSIRERAWIEDPSRQCRERPIPNFHLLLQDAVTLTDPLEAYANITLENHMTLEALSTPGHSQGSMSFLYNGLVLFSGDVIPVRGDIPIYTNVQEERAALKLLSTYRSIAYCCPAWDHVYRCEEGLKNWRMPCVLSVNMTAVSGKFCQTIRKRKRNSCLSWSVNKGRCSNSKRIRCFVRLFTHISPIAGIMICTDICS